MITVEGVTGELVPAGHHFHGDDCPDGHRQPGGSICVHLSWACDHCHDDPPPHHRCPRCGRYGPG